MAQVEENAELKSLVGAMQRLQAVAGQVRAKDYPLAS